MVAVNSEISGRRLMSVCPNDMKNSLLAGTKFRVEESDNNSEKLESKVGANIIRELNKNMNNKGSIIKLKVGENDV